MNHEQFCNKLISLSNEDEVKELLNSWSESKNPTNWFPLGNNKDNAAIVQNTSGEVSSGIAEMITNAQDAIVEFGKVQIEKMGGSMDWSSPAKAASNMSSEFKTQNPIRTVFLEDNHGSSSFAVLDTGCGQSASNFSSTFCSLGAGGINKAKKPWLQGQYGQGSTASHTISGMEGYKLIVSRTDINEDWGFTLIRRCPDEPAMMEYLMINGKVPTFYADKIYFSYSSSGKLIERNTIHDAVLERGTGVKIFSFTPPAKGFEAIKDLLTMGFAKLNWPVISLEYTQAVENRNNNQDVDRRHNVCGIEDELEIHYNKTYPSGKKSHFINAKIELSFGCVYLKIYVMSTDALSEMKCLHGRMRWKRLFHHNNNQIQHMHEQSFISDIFHYIKKSVFVVADLSHINPKVATAYIWKADRTSFNTSGKYYKEYTDKLTAFLKNSVELKKIDKEFHDQLMSSVNKNDGTNNPLTSISNNVFGKSLYHSVKGLKPTKNNHPASHAQTIPEEDFDVELTGNSVTEQFNFENEKLVSPLHLVQGIPNNQKTPTKTKKGHAPSNPKHTTNGSARTKAKVPNTANSQVASKMLSVTTTHNGIEHELDSSHYEMNTSHSKADNTHVVHFIPKEGTFESQLPVGSLVKIIIEFELTDDGENNGVTITSKKILTQYYEIVEAKIPQKNNKTSGLNVNSNFLTKDGRIVLGNKTTSFKEFYSNFNTEYDEKMAVSIPWKLMRGTTEDTLVFWVNLDNDTLKHPSINEEQIFHHSAHYLKTAFDREQKKNTDKFDFSVFENKMNNEEMLDCYNTAILSSAITTLNAKADALKANKD